VLSLTSHDVLPIVVGASFAAGLNVYATVATLGLLARFHAFELPSSLHLLETWPVIGIALALFALELFADKIPVFDLLWNALHTFVRVPVAALLAYAATQHLSPGAQIAAAALGALIALAAHSGKTAVRAVVTTSPEPVSNVALSFGEDVVAVALTWFATRHPLIAAAIVAVLLLIIVITIRFVVRSLRRLLQRARAALSKT
jgi:hypothetical protein